MRIPLDRESPVPLWRQIERFLKEQIQTGALQPDAKLPSIRELATSLGVSRITAANAYAEMAAEGLVIPRWGSGTYVAPLYPKSSTDGFAPPQDWPLWQQELLTHTWQPACPELAHQLSAATRPGTISFAEQVAPDDDWPADGFRKALNAVLACEGPAAVGPGEHTAGYLPLRRTVAEILTSEGIPTWPDNIIITSGSQQALSLVTELLTRVGDVVLVESPTYNVAIDLFRSCGVRVLGVPVDEEGMQVQKVEEMLHAVRPRLIYTVPTFQNPTGTCMSGVRRRQLVALADRYDIPILEDDFIGNLRYDGRAEPTLKALAPPGCVILVGTFSKVLMPGLRIGYLVAEGPVYDRLLTAKYVCDLETSNLMQRALYEYISVGRFHAHLRHVIRAHRIRRDAMCDALSRYAPKGAFWRIPKGGRFVWLQLPSGQSANELFPLAAEEGVTFVPGSFFFPGERPQSYLRLNFALNPPNLIEEGVRRLGRAMAALANTTAARSDAGPRARAMKRVMID